MRLDTNGNRIWDQSFGGSSWDDLYSVQQTADGGFILGGRSQSGLGGNKISPNFGGQDYWVVRLDTDGNKLWERSFGGTSGDLFGQVCQTADGGFILVGGSPSGTSGNKTSLGFGNQDIWLVRLDAQGNKLWEQAYGGSDGDTAASIQQTSDGGFILGGASFSRADGNKTTPVFGGLDLWIIKLSPEPPSLRLLPQSFADIGSSGYRFVLTGLSNQTCVLEHSADMLAWTPFQTNLITDDTVEIIDATASNSAVRFYRARLVQ